MEHITLKIGGMTCMGCVRTLNKVLSALPGVDTVDIELASGDARIGFDPVLAKPADFATAIEGAGFDLA